jgi:uncharacterized protein (TIGR02246 family)
MKSIMYTSPIRNLSNYKPKFKTMKKIIAMSIIGLFYFSSTFAVTAFDQQADKKKADLKTEEKAIRSISMKWLELQKSHDAAGVAALFADDGVEYSMNQEPFVGPAAIQKWIIQDRKQNPNEVSNWTTDRVEIAASGDLAVEYGSYTDTGSGLSGTETDQGKYVTVYRKVNGIWKVASDIGTSTKPKDASK